MMALRIACDLDGTVADMDAALQREARRLFGPDVDLHAAATRPMESAEDVEGQLATGEGGADDPAPVEQVPAARSLTRSSTSPIEYTGWMRVWRTPGGTASRRSRHTRNGVAFESVTTSRQFSGRSSMTASSDRACATRPREPFITNTDGNSNPCACSHRCDCTCAVSPAEGGRCVRTRTSH